MNFLPPSHNPPQLVWLIPFLKEDAEQIRPSCTAMPYQRPATPQQIPYCPPVCRALGQDKNKYIDWAHSSDSNEKRWSIICSNCFIITAIHVRPINLYRPSGDSHWGKLGDTRLSFLCAQQYVLKWIGMAYSCPPIVMTTSSDGRTDAFSLSSAACWMVVLSTTTTYG